MQHAKASLHLTFDQIREEKAEHEAALLCRPDLRTPYSKKDAYHLLFPESPGVYCISDKGVPVYVGETGQLRGRMRDLRETLNHTFRRSLGKTLFENRPGFVPATASRRFQRSLEVELDGYMEQHIAICGRVVYFGRKEVEEYLVHKHSPRYCTKGQRGVKR